MLDFLFLDEAAEKLFLIEAKGQKAEDWIKKYHSPENGHFFTVTDYISLDERQVMPHYKNAVERDSDALKVIEIFKEMKIMGLEKWKAQWEEIA